MAGWYLKVLCYEASYGHASSGIRTRDLEMQSQERLPLSHPNASSDPRLRYSHEQACGHEKPLKRLDQIS